MSGYKPGPRIFPPVTSTTGTSNKRRGLVQDFLSADLNEFYLDVLSGKSSLSSDYVFRDWEGEVKILAVVLVQATPQR